MWINQTNMLFKVVVGILVVYVIGFGLIPGIVICLMGKTRKLTSAASVPLTEPETNQEQK